MKGPPWIQARLRQPSRQWRRGARRCLGKAIMTGPNALSMARGRPAQPGPSGNGRQQLPNRITVYALVSVRQAVAAACSAFWLGAEQGEHAAVRIGEVRDNHAVLEFHRRDDDLAAE